MTHTDSLILTYRPIPPLLVWRVHIHPQGVPLWSWHCDLCERSPLQPSWLEAMADGLDHLCDVHGCPSMRASGEPCDEFCADCGGRMWIK